MGAITLTRPRAKLNEFLRDSLLFVDEGMSHRRSKNNVLVDCINAVKAAKEANLARQANEGSASAEGSSFANYGGW